MISWYNVLRLETKHRRRVLVRMVVSINTHTYIFVWFIYCRSSPGGGWRAREKDEWIHRWCLCGGTKNDMGGRSNCCIICAAAEEGVRWGRQYIIYIYVLKRGAMVILGDAACVYATFFLRPNKEKFPMNTRHGIVMGDDVVQTRACKGRADHRERSRWHVMARENKRPCSSSKLYVGAACCSQNYWYTYYLLHNAVCIFGYVWHGGRDQWRIYEWACCRSRWINHSSTLVQ